jgi:solute carrier family 34 (sodium-dependent phosphate cotransporter)
MIGEPQQTAGPSEEVATSRTGLAAAVGVPGSRALAVIRQVAWQKVLLFVVSIFLFILAITLMKEGARGLAPLLESRLVISNAMNSLGFGWLFAYVVMSGSPVAASALTFFDAGLIDKMGAFTMITGSRLGASFIVLFIGFVHVLRGRSRAESLGVGLMALSVTGVTYVVALGIGAIALTSGLFDNVQLQTHTLINSVTDAIFDPVAHMLLSILPQWSLFIVGLGIILLSFNLFDRCLPQVSLRKSHLGQVSRLVYRPWVMFLLGSLITLVSMSVSVSLGILVPLSARGFVRRENLIPYIMGANITTFIDTLLAAVLLRNPAAFTVVFIEMASITVVSIIILALIYRHFEHAMLTFVGWLTMANRNLALFMIVIFTTPLILMLL